MGGVILNPDMANLMLIPYGCASYTGMGVFLQLPNTLMANIREVGE